MMAQEIQSCVTFWSHTMLKRWRREFIASLLQQQHSCAIVSRPNTVPTLFNIDATAKNHGASLLHEHAGSTRHEWTLCENASRFGLTADAEKRNDIVSSVIGPLRQDGKVLENGQNGGWRVMSDTELRVQVGKDLWAMRGNARSFESGAPSNSEMLRENDDFNADRHFKQIRTNKPFRAFGWISEHCQH